MNKRIIYYRSLYKRDFLWRHRPTPYKILIAEFMLQRTKADQVEPVYKKFLRQYPTIKHLATGKSKSISKYTNSLGLHGRYKKFLDASKFIIKELGGKFPKTQQELRIIPGVGEYIAGAIAAVCFNKADYVIDSNIARFINRYHNLELSGEIRRKKIIIEKAKKLFNVKDQKIFLFTLLDFTAIICKPTNPKCKICILVKNCRYSKKYY